jgi:splicing factor 3B subunit 3
VVAIPQRHPPDRGILITQITVRRQKKIKFFALAQTELGDVYKVNLQLDSADKTKVIGMTVAVLDTLRWPMPLCQ